MDDMEGEKNMTQEELNKILEDHALWLEGKGGKQRLVPISENAVREIILYMEDRKELDILGSHLSPYAYPFVIENMMKGNLKTDGVVSSMFKIEEWEKAFDYASGKYGDFKVAFKFE